RRPFHLIYRLQRRDGTWRYLEEWGAGVFAGETVQYLEGFIQDVTERELARERIEYLATHDPLTGLYNRLFLEEVLQRKNLSYPLGVLLCDVNGLRLVNEAFGQGKGNEFLSCVAQALREECPPDAFLFRFGGDEFLVLLPEASEETLRNLGHNLAGCCLGKCSDPIPLSLSVGWSLGEDPEEPFELVLSRAEQWLHRRKLTEDRSAHSAIVALLERSLQETTQETEAHAQRMVTLTRRLGEALKLHDEDLEKLELLARLHDLGKIAVPPGILDKPGSLTPQEWEVVRRHPEAGYRIAQASFDLTSIAPAILAHHERYDGTGYPQGLRGEEIPLLARIVAVVDAYDVMRTGRPYKPPMGKDEAIAELRRCSGTQFDPRVVEVFLHILERE
ncbi:MAG: bifunctional diguanylate cyclase/phosphohydrolase, partial [Candidatus Caldatribacteriaceae bacterium]